MKGEVAGVGRDGTDAVSTGVFALWAVLAVLLVYCVLNPQHLLVIDNWWPQTLGAVAIVGGGAVIGLLWRRRRSTWRTAAIAVTIVVIVGVGVGGVVLALLRSVMQSGGGVRSSVISPTGVREVVMVDEGLEKRFTFLVRSNRGLLSQERPLLSILPTDPSMRFVGPDELQITRSQSSYGSITVRFVHDSIEIIGVDCENPSCPYVYR